MEKNTESRLGIAMMFFVCAVVTVAGLQCISNESTFVLGTMLLFFALVIIGAAYYLFYGGIGDVGQEEQNEHVVDVTKYGFNEKVLLRYNDQGVRILADSISKENKLFRLTVMDLFNSREFHEVAKTLDFCPLELAAIIETNVPKYPAT